MIQMGSTKGNKRKTLRERLCLWTASGFLVDGGSGQRWRRDGGDRERKRDTEIERGWRAAQLPLQSK